MKATDLKINDIVTYHHEVVTIREIRKDTVQIQFQDGELTMANLNQIKPCGIFYKILKKNNFKTIYFDDILIMDITSKNDDIQALNIGKTPFGYYYVQLHNSSPNNITAMHLCDIKYMHELQHIIAIFGKEISL